MLIVTLAVPWLIIVADAPEESSMLSPTTLNASSITISSFAFEEVLSVPFKTNCSPKVSSSASNLSPLAKSGSEGLPSNKMENPACSLNNLSPAFSPEAEVPSKDIKPKPSD